MTDADEARARVRRLLLSGDNILKNRDDASRERALARYREALDAARDVGLTDLVPIIEVRLADAGAAADGH
ncbi:MAG TPA: hypothetical protein VNT51_04960 [Miltoncostaeaceae bacterium]|nr:hypothetical protein [Miltoncostaeaceae bacterium]